MHEIHPTEAKNLRGLISTIQRTQLPFINDDKRPMPFNLDGQHSYKQS